MQQSHAAENFDQILHIFETSLLMMQFLETPFWWKTHTCERTQTQREIHTPDMLWLNIRPAVRKEGGEERKTSDPLVLLSINPPSPTNSPDRQTHIVTDMGRNERTHASSPLLVFHKFLHHGCTAAVRGCSFLPSTSKFLCSDNKGQQHEIKLGVDLLPKKALKIAWRMMLPEILI